MNSDYWLLPDGVDELLPPLSWHMETLRRKLLDQFYSHGYELLSPPMVEYLEALLTGTGNDLDIQTFKLVDQWTGRTLGIRPDITPQVARIDAHQLRRDEPSRYCYIGTVLRARPSTLSGARNPMQLGAEIFGHQGVHSDIEIIDLMLRSLAVAGIDSVSLDIGHVGIFRGLAHAANLDPETEHSLFNSLQRKAVPEIKERLQSLNLPTALFNAFIKLAMLSGKESVLQEARAILSPLGIDEVDQALKALTEIAVHLRIRLPNIVIHYDLAELRGYAYKTGVVFAAFVPGYGSEIARGGRYDDIGSHFGCARPATGFSADLKTWVHLLTRVQPSADELIFAPINNEVSLHNEVERLRHAGRRVVSELKGQVGSAKSMGCSHQLVKQSDQWVVVAI